MMADGQLVDGSWDLTINVTDLNIEKTLRVKGDLHIGGLMLKLVEALDITMDWSDHALWWPARNQWLTRTRSTLDQFSVQADSSLWFTPMHKDLTVVMPDQQKMELRVDFSINVFSAVINICKELGIRHPEEVSLARRLSPEDLKRQTLIIEPVRREARPTRGISHGNGTLMRSAKENGDPSGSPSLMVPRSPRIPHTPHGTIQRVPGTPITPYSYGTLNSSASPRLYNSTLSPGSMHSLAFEGASESTLANSPTVSACSALPALNKPKSQIEKARINSSWLDSSRSLLEQGISEHQLLLLRFKFFVFYDLNAKYDPIRINQIYEQARWSLISEEIDCTEEEMMMFAALQFQVRQQASLPQPDNDASITKGEDEVDAALNDLQCSLEGSSLSTSNDITHIPELSDYLKFCKPKKFAFQSYKRFFFTFKDTHLCMFKDEKDKDGAPIEKVNIKGCEVHPDVKIGGRKYIIKLCVPYREGMTEVWIKTASEEQYSKWMAACKLASKGRTMADSSYQQEVKNICDLLSMQHPADAPSLNPNSLDLHPEDFVAQRFLKKLKSRQIATSILEAHVNVQNLKLLEAKLAFIRAWQALPEYGLSYFLVKFKNSKKEELLAIASNRMLTMDSHTGDSRKTWRFSDMKTWKVNWQIEQVEVEFEKEKVQFHCLSSNCKVVHEFLGGYIFLSMRSGEKSQALNEEMFHKLTGGWL